MAHNFYETAPAPATTNPTAILRLANGCTETDNNALDFAANTPTPRNSSSPLNSCAVADAAPEVSGTYPANGATDFPVDANLTVTFSEPVNVTCPGLPCLLGERPSNNGLSGGPTTFTLDPA